MDRWSFFILLSTSLIPFPPLVPPPFLLTTYVLPGLLASWPRMALLIALSFIASDISDELATASAFFLAAASLVLARLFFLARASATLAMGLVARLRNFSFILASSSGGIGN